MVATSLMCSFILALALAFSVIVSVTGNYSLFIRAIEDVWSPFSGFIIVSTGGLQVKLCEAQVCRDSKIDIPF